SVTDALAFEGLRHISRSLVQVYHNPGDVELRSSMSLAAYLSGITLTNAGLGLVHGFAGTIGGFYDIAHGVVCSSLMWSSNVGTLKKLRSEKDSPIALRKYANAGKLFTS